MNGSFGQQNSLFPSLNTRNTFLSRLILNRPHAMNLAFDSGTDSCCSGEVQRTGHDICRTDGATSGTQSDVDAELSKFCTLFEPDSSSPTEHVAHSPPLTHSSGLLTTSRLDARPPSASSPCQIYAPPPYPPGGSAQGAYPMNCNAALSWTPPPTSILELVSQSPFPWFPSHPHPANAFQLTTMDAETRRTMLQTDFSGWSGPVWPVYQPLNVALGPYGSHEPARSMSLPTLSHSQATTPTYSPMVPHTPVDGADYENIASSQSQSHSPFIPVVVNDQEANNVSFDKPLDTTPTLALSLGLETQADSSSTLPTPAISVEQEPHYASAVDSSNITPMPASFFEHQIQYGRAAVDSLDNAVPVDHSARALAFQMAFRLPDHPSTSTSSSSTKRKRVDTSTHTNAQEGKSAAVPFEKRRTRRRCKELTPSSESTSSFASLSETLQDRGLCKFPVTDGSGVTRRCGHGLVKDAKSVRAHFAVHYEQLGYYTRRDDLIEAALAKGVSANQAKKEDFKVRCPWCDEEATLFGGLNRHIVDKELQLNSVRCGCGGRNSRGNQKHNGKRHDDSETHKSWVRKITRESEAVAGRSREEVAGVPPEDGGEESVGDDGVDNSDYIDDKEEGSSKGTERRRF